MLAGLAKRAVVLLLVERTAPATAVMRGVSSSPYMCPVSMAYWASASFGTTNAQAKSATASAPRGRPRVRPGTRARAWARANMMTFPLSKNDAGGQETRVLGPSLIQLQRLTQG